MIIRLKVWDHMSQLSRGSTRGPYALPKSSGHIMFKTNVNAINLATVTELNNNKNMNKLCKRIYIQDICHILTPTLWKIIEVTSVILKRLAYSIKEDTLRNVRLVLALVV